MGAISPVGNDIKTVWESLISGKCGIDFIKGFNTSDFKVKVAAEVKDFDPLLYMEKNEIRRNDLFTLYAMAAATQAMEASGLAGKIDPERLGVYIGSGIGGIHTFFNECERFADGGARKVSPLFIPKIIMNMAAGAVSIKFEAKGPAVPMATACATSTNLIGEAFRAIKFGYADAIITGGAEATINPLALAGFSNMMALSTKNIVDESSIPFDKRRDGFVMGEGAGMLILEELEHAKERGAKIYAEIIGYGNTCDAYHITAPEPEGGGAARAIELALQEANLSVMENIYINAHGTSTPLNDKVETNAIKSVFKEQAKNIPISSTKSMTGHMLGAAGAIEAIACIMALEKGIIPPTINYREPDPDCYLDYVPNKARKVNIDYAISNSLGFGGHNASIIFKKV
jgi:3-oxoacyl-[acyl-carrier-protein] synthase II